MHLQSCISNLGVNRLQVFWAFSLYLEAVAILPQLVMLQRSGNVDNLTGQYVFFLGYIITFCMTCIILQSLLSCGWLGLRFSCCLLCATLFNVDMFKDLASMLGTMTNINKLRCLVSFSFLYVITLLKDTTTIHFCYIFTD